MTPFDPQMPAMLQNILALSGANDQGAASPLQDLQQVEQASRDDWFKKNKDLNEHRQALMDAANKIQDFKPTQSNFDQIQQRISDMLDDNSEYNQKYKNDVLSLQQQVQKMPSLPDQLRDRNKYINQRIEQAYGSKFDQQGNLIGHSKLGMAAQFLQDLLRAKGTPSGRQAVYEQAGKEYDQSVKDSLEQQQAQRQNAISQIQLLGEQRKNEAQKYAALSQSAQRDLAAQRLNLDRMTRGANIVLSGMKLEDAVKNADVKNMVQAFDAQYGKTAPEQRLQALAQDLAGNGMPIEQAKIQAAEIMSLVEGLKRVPAMMGSTTVQSETPAHVDHATGQMVPGTSTSQRIPTGQLPNILQMIQGMQSPQSQMPWKPGQPFFQGQQPQSQVTPQQKPRLMKTQPTASGADEWNPQQHSYKFADGSIPTQNAIRMGMLQQAPPSSSSGFSGNLSKSGLGAVNETNQSDAQKIWDNYDKWAPSPWQAAWGKKPAWDSTLFSQKQKTENDFLPNGKEGQRVLALNTALNHMDLLAKLVPQMRNDPLQISNWFKQHVAEWSGDPTIVGWNTVANRLAKEITKAYVNTGGGVAERKGLEEELGASQSPQQFVSIIQKNIDLLTGANRALGDAYNQGTFGLGQKRTIFPEAQKIIDSLQGSQGPKTRADVKKGDVYRGYQFTGDTEAEKNDQSKWKKVGK